MQHWLLLHQTTLMMEAEAVSEMLDYNPTLRWLMAQEGLSAHCCFQQLFSPAWEKFQQ
jgi:hypothetical protein